MYYTNHLSTWISEIQNVVQPDQIHWCKTANLSYYISVLENQDELYKLNSNTFPNCFLYRSHSSDVARVEHLTYICTLNKNDAGPNNNWMDIHEAKTKMLNLFKNCMKGRTMYIIPYCMGPLDSPYSSCGVEITDSLYVVINMLIMTRVDDIVLSRISNGESFVKGIHSIGQLDPDNRFIMHFPEESLIMSFGSGYGGNALLGKKCHALRIASYQGFKNGWLAEHMLIVKIKTPQKKEYYIAAAFPSACGKTNLAMLIPPDTIEPGWEITTIGDDIAWLFPNSDGKLYAINPEAGYFGVVPGTNHKTNKNAFDMIHTDTIFTNTALTADNEPWWEGLEDGIPVVDWQGNTTFNKAAHPNSRFTVSMKNNPCYAIESENPQGVPISAIIFGGRRKNTIPLVYEGRNWEHGIFMGVSLSSETTAAATGELGILRRDPMAMKPFLGYNYGDYWNHWSDIGKKLTNPPGIFYVNWFRKSETDEYLWPGYGENLRVIDWIIKRHEQQCSFIDTPIGYIPRVEDLNLNGIQLKMDLFEIEATEWEIEITEIIKYLHQYSDRVPKFLYDIADDILHKLRNFINE